MIWGVGVNDHYGPTFLADSVEFDSGKTVILAQSLDESEVRAAFSDGRLFAVRDLGTTKGLYPQIDSINVMNGHIITIETTDSVRWISMGAQVGTGPSFNVGSLADSKKYIRAEVENADGSIVYLQPFGLRPAPLPPCGFGPELAVLLPLLGALRRVRQTRGNRVG